MIFDSIQALFALFRIRFRNGNTPFDQIEGKQRSKQLGQAGLRNLHVGGDGGWTPVAGCNAFQDGEVTADLLDLMRQQEGRFLIQHALRIEDVPADRLLQIRFRCQHLHIARHTAGNGIPLDQHVLIHCRVICGKMTERQGLQPYLTIPAPIEGAVVMQCLRFHHTDVGTAEDDHDSRRFEDDVIQPLHDARKSSVGMTQILELINDKHLFPGHAGKYRHEAIPTDADRLAQQIVLHEVGHQLTQIR